MSYHKWLKGAGSGPLPRQQEYDPRQVYVSSFWTVPESLRKEAERLVPEGLRTLHKYSYTPDSATGEQRVLIISVYEKSQGASSFLLDRALCDLPCVLLQF